MRDAIIIAAVAVIFPLFGLAVFFWWRTQYGVWSIQRKEREDAEGEVVVIDDPPAARKSTTGMANGAEPAGSSDAVGSAVPTGRPPDSASPARNEPLASPKHKSTI